MIHRKKLALWMRKMGALGPSLTYSP